MNSRHHVLVSILTCSTLAWSANPGSAAEWFLRTRAGGWTWMTFPGPATSIPSEVLQESYDDSSWPVGAAPFGLVDGVCTTPVGTVWDPGAMSIVVRHRIDIPFETSRLVFGVQLGKGSCAIYVNGVHRGTVTTTGGCGGGSETNPVSPWPPVSTIGWRFGSNTLVLVGENTTGTRRLDSYAYGDLSAVPITPGTWGRLKSLYR